ncbi:MAG: hypothetical protein P4L90_25960 [Rhodopila sp.]|nr:hypothetical protein [Rhodopila sp.]
MSVFKALLLVARSPYSLRRRHEWRKPQVHSVGLWPHVTFGWWTWDPLPPVFGERMAHLIDTMRTAPNPPPPDVPGAPTLF